MVIYELHIGSFVFDPASPRGKGSFAAAIGKLDYLRDLDVNAIEAMAVAEFDTDVSWGYNRSTSCYRRSVWRAERLPRFRQRGPRCAESR
jgi:1,4-alpha-glucan branching enzyme